MAISGKKALMPRLLAVVGDAFERIPDGADGAATQFTTRDVLMSGLAMFSLKFPSMLQFDAHSRRDDRVRRNLKTLFDIERAPCDTTLRTRLDTVDPDALHTVFRRLFAFLRTNHYLDDFRLPDGAYPIVLDGTGTHRSNVVRCDTCLRRERRNGKTEYHHGLVAAALVRPDGAAPMPIGVEALVNRDGRYVKQDCERNAAKRLLDRLARQRQGSRFLVLGDDLYANVPMIEKMAALGMSFLLVAKPRSHRHLYAQMDNQPTAWLARARPAPKVARWEARCWEGLQLVAADDRRVNVIEFVETDDQGTEHTWVWITDRAVSPANLFELATLARRRWRIENGVFQTLKDHQGVSLEHNYGHGQRHLSTVLAMLMMLALWLDRVQAHFCQRFQAAKAHEGAWRNLWETTRGCFRLFDHASWDALYGMIANLNEAPDTS